MKKLYFEWIWQWIGGPWIGFNPVGIEFEYDKYEPTMALKIVLLGVGFVITWLCPWKTKESEYAEECMKNNMWQILSVDPQEFDGTNSRN
jgi:hypothetical protein